MTIYENIKAAISVKQAAEHYGLKVNRSGMTCCPFHNDRHPSLKLNEDYFFCFGCGAKGDVIDLVAKLFNLSNHEAVQKLAADFGLDPKPPTAAAMVKPKRPYIRQFREDEMLCFRVLTDYLHLLEDSLVFFLMTRKGKHNSFRQNRRRKEFKKAVSRGEAEYRNPNGITKHKCAICGRTEKDDPNLEFRFCSRCNGNYEYCQIGRAHV